MRNKAKDDRGQRHLWGGLRIAGLFAGIGGLERGIHLAAEAAGIDCETRLLCEIDSAAVAVLEDKIIAPSARTGSRKIAFESDVTKLDRIPRDVNLLTAGFPCQDLSQAGKAVGVSHILKDGASARRAGLRSGLVGQVFRLLEDRIEARSPVEWVLIENVPFMLQLDRGKAMSLIVDALESLGYSWAYRVVDAISFGLPQRRRRVYLLAHHRRGNRRDEAPCQALLAEPGRDRRERTWRRGANSFGFFWTEGIRGLGSAVDAVPTLKGGSTVGIPSPPAVLLPDGAVVTPDIQDAEELQGFPANWTEPAERAVRSTLRWKLVGNAVSVRAAKWIGERLLNPQDFDPRTRTELKRESSWPFAGWGDGIDRFDASSLVTLWPRAERLVPIHDFLARANRRGRSLRLLSERATAGFLRRTDSAECTLRFEAGFKEALREHLSHVARTSSESKVSQSAHRKRGVTFFERGLLP